MGAGIWKIIPNLVVRKYRKVLFLQSGKLYLEGHHNLHANTKTTNKNIVLHFHAGYINFTLWRSKIEFFEVLKMICKLFRNDSTKFKTKKKKTFKVASEILLKPDIRVPIFSRPAHQNQW